jgi:outer membrane protein TolC
MNNRSVDISKFSLLVPLFLTGCLYAWAADTTVPPAGITLEECYSRAWHLSETLGISEENVRFIQAQYKDKLGNVLPHVDWIKTQFYQDRATPSGTAIANSTFLVVQPESYFQLTQPIFAGFRDWYAVDIVKSQKLQSEFDVHQTELQLLSDVATAFYTALTQHEQLTTLQDTRQATLDRVKELEHWVNVGRSLQSDLLSAQTQVATLDAQILDAKRIEQESRELLRYLTGVAPEIPLVDDRPDPVSVPLETALSHSTRRPDIMSGEEAIHQARLGVKYAKGSYLPILGFTGRWFTERIGFESNIRWDATLTLDVPLLEGGSNHAQIQEARSQDIIAELTFARLKRNVEQLVRTAQQDLGISVSESTAYKIAADLGQKNYEAQLKEYRLGRTSNIEVLQVLANLQDVKRQWVASKYASKLDDVILRISTGEGL